MNKKKRVILTLFLSTALLMPVAVTAAQTVEGHLEALDCIIYGKPCPVDYLDPHISLVSDFVLFLGKSDEHYLLPNIPRKVKEKYIGSAILVTGEVNTKYKAITATKLEVKRSGVYKIVWSSKSEPDDWARWREEFYGSNPYGH